MNRPPFGETEQELISSTTYKPTSTGTPWSNWLLVLRYEPWGLYQPSQTTVRVDCT
jgi:hypothetical protein